jgi:hypothetical protein
MKDREDFVRFAAASALQASSNAGERKARAVDAKATAEELADLFGYDGDPDEVGRLRARLDHEQRAHQITADGLKLNVQRLSDLEAAGVTMARVDELEQLGATNAKRIADLEAQLREAQTIKPERGRR